MAGIYIHIPFCRRKCYYCDFYKTLKTEQTGVFLQALEKEAQSRKDEWNNEPVETIYLGGGTPSILTEKEVAFIFRFLNRYFTVRSDAEITFEANPDDLTPDYLAGLKNTGVNRLSIGIQSFNDDQLQKMNRRHHARQASESIENALNAGYTNLSTDLIFGLPGLSGQEWRKSLKTMFHYPVTHLSAYHLTYHKGTPFYRWLKEGSIRELSEEDSVMQFEILLEEAEQAGFEQYEISNFARSGMYARHNTAYWTGRKYLGLGPSAHSYNGQSRRWNVASLSSYLQHAGKDKNYWEEEELSVNERYNEHVLTRLRTRWGVSVYELETAFGHEKASRFVRQAAEYLSAGKMKEENGVYTLTREGMFISDYLMAEFMVI